MNQSTVETLYNRIKTHCTENPVNVIIPKTKSNDLTIMVSHALNADCVFEIRRSKPRETPQVV